MKFSDFVVHEAILTDLQATTKEGAFREIVRSLHRAGALAEADLESITRGLLDREELGSTGIGQGMAFLGQGVALPETRHPAVDRGIGTVARSRRGVEWDAWDGEAVDLLFLLISPRNQPGHFLRGMLIIKCHLHDERFVTRLRQAETREQVIALLDEADQVLAVFPSQDELTQLPLRALVAYAARCARRVQPFFALSDDHPEKQRHVAAVERAIRIAEEFVRGIPVAASDATEASDAASKASHAAAWPAWAATRAATGAARAAARAAARDSAWFTSFTYYAWSAVEDWCIAAQATEARAAGAAAARSDFDQLRRLGLGQFPELGEPIDPSEDGPLGPLWPEEKRGAAAHPQESGSSEMNGPEAGRA
jgi:PTS system nitrogen regulatory IIA component